MWQNAPSNGASTSIGQHTTRPCRLLSQSFFSSERQRQRCDRKKKIDIWPRGAITFREWTRKYSRSTIYYVKQWTCVHCFCFPLPLFYCLSIIFISFSVTKVLKIKTSINIVMPSIFTRTYWEEYFFSISVKSLNLLDWLISFHSN